MSTHSLGDHKFRALAMDHFHGNPNLQESLAEKFHTGLRYRLDGPYALCFRE
jgi:hypothetical protein